jgi:hypothetical protein
MDTKDVASYENNGQTHPQEWVLVNKKQRNKNIGYNNGPPRGQVKVSNYKVKKDHLEYEVITIKRNGQTKSYQGDKE